MNSIDPRSRQWNHLTEEGTPPAIPPPINESDAPQTPSGLGYVVGNNSGSIRAMLYWSRPAAGKTVEAQYKVSSSPDWLSVTLSSSRDNDTTLNGLISGENYDFRVRFADAAIGVSPYATVTFTATPLAGTTGALQSLTAKGAARRISVRVRQASEAPAAYIQVIRMTSGASPVWTGATSQELQSGAISDSVAFSDIEAAVYDIYARSVGINGDTGPASGPVSVTVTEAVVDTGSGGSNGNSFPGGSSQNDGQGNYVPSILSGGTGGVQLVRPGEGSSTDGNYSPDGGGGLY
jgi:hypothetical protein